MILAVGAVCLCRHPEGGEPGGPAAARLRLDRPRRDQPDRCRAPADRADGGRVRRHRGPREDVERGRRGLRQRAAGIRRRAATSTRRSTRCARPRTGSEGELPDDADDLIVTEINTALFPIITAILSGPVPERTLNDAGRGRAGRGRGAARRAGGRYRRRARRVSRGADRSHGLPDLQPQLRRADQPAAAQQPADRGRRDRDRRRAHRAEGAGPDRGHRGRDGHAGEGRAATRS